MFCLSIALEIDLKYGRKCSLFISMAEHLLPMSYKSNYIAFITFNGHTLNIGLTI